MRLTPLHQIGSECLTRLNANYQQLLDVLGPANATDLDDEDKVGASWGFTDEQGRAAFVWAYGFPGAAAITCRRWSTGGNLELLEQLFPGQLG